MNLTGSVGFLGYGNMGAAILEGLVERETVSADRSVVFDLDETRLDAAAALGARTVASIAELAAESDVMVLAVKPQQMGDVLAELRSTFRTDTLAVSIAAGIPIARICGQLGPATRIARVMPNTPALVGAGAAALAFSASCTEADRATAQTIFEAVGIAVEVPEEAMDAVTALSGSGPAYFFYMVECLTTAAEREGLDRGAATRLAAQTLLGAGRLLAESGESASTLRERVTSKGGTTAAALASFRASNLDNVVQQAVTAAAERSRELGQQEV